MGASGWDYFTPYDDDVAGVLEALRQRVFASGEYYREDESGAPVTDADSLLAAQPESGTHSIIDICEGVSAQPADFTTAPLTNDELLDAFKTTRPSSEAVRDWAADGSVMSVRERWSGAHIVTYLDGQPHEIAFVGVSGD